MLARALLVLTVLVVPSIASAADPYQWVGATSVAFTGDGNGLGFVGMTTQCRADFGAGARMCASKDILESDTLNPNEIPAQGCWVRPSWAPNGQGFLDESGSATSAASMTCFGWMSNNPGVYGLALSPTGSLGWFPHPNSEPNACSQARPVACCKPTPVPAPSASLSIPVGTMGLVWLSMLKGAA
ncbi:MAG: hypothetical protein R3F35_01720 [Myxococcota bacterium]